VPHTKQAFLDFYEIKKKTFKIQTQAFSQMLGEPVSSEEVMESREGCAACKSPYDGKMYIFGGRNIHPLNKLETYDPIRNQFKVVNRESFTIVLGRYNHTMLSYKN
jgi:hypothetical protein